MIRGIDHIELIVRDVDEFVRFFEAMGFEVILRTEHHGGSAELKLPGEGQPVFEIHSVGGEEAIGRRAPKDKRITSHCWAALAVAVTYQDQTRPVF